MVYDLETYIPFSVEHFVAGFAKQLSPTLARYFIFHRVFSDFPITLTIYNRYGQSKEEYEIEVLEYQMLNSNDVKELFGEKIYNCLVKVGLIGTDKDVNLRF